MFPIAMMQGRLSPGQEGRLQFFPRDWEAEFLVAKEMGFAGVCWFIDHQPSLNDALALWRDAAFLGRLDVARALLPITSVDAGPFSFAVADREQTVTQLGQLFPAMRGRLSTNVFNLPLLEQTTLQGMDEAEYRGAVEALRRVVKLAAESEMKIGLETDLPREKLRALIEEIALPTVGVCYDIGNCTSYQFPCAEDLHELRDVLLEVHLKDRPYGVPRSVRLGEGDAPIKACLEVLQRDGYQGILTMQAFRSDATYLDDARGQKEFIESLT